MSTEAARALGRQEAADILEHYGVKGMKWGVRRKRDEKARAAQFGGRRNREVHPDYIKSRESKSKKVYELSDSELKQLNNRLQQEQRLMQLSPGRVESGHRKAKAMLALAGTAASAYALYNSPAGKAAVELGRRVIGYENASKVFIENLDRI